MLWTENSRATIDLHRRYKRACRRLRLQQKRTCHDFLDRAFLKKYEQNTHGNLIRQKNQEQDVRKKEELYEVIHLFREFKSMNSMQISSRMNLAHRRIDVYYQVRQKRPAPRLYSFGRRPIQPQQIQQQQQQLQQQQIQQMQQQQQFQPIQFNVPVESISPPSSIASYPPIEKYFEEVERVEQMAITLDAMGRETLREAQFSDEQIERLLATHNNGS